MCQMGSSWIGRLVSGHHQLMLWFNIEQMTSFGQTEKLLPFENTEKIVRPLNISGKNEYINYIDKANYLEVYPPIYLIHTETKDGFLGITT